MAKETRGNCLIRIVLAEEKRIAGVIRNPGYVLLEGICLEKVTSADVDKAIQLGQVTVATVKPKKDNKAEGSE